MAEERLQVINNHLKQSGICLTTSIVISLLFIKYKMDQLTGGLWPEPPIHDPVAVAYLIDPSLFECRLMRVDVEMV